MKKNTNNIIKIIVKHPFKTILLALTLGLVLNFYSNKSHSISKDEENSAIDFFLSSKKGKLEEKSSTQITDSKFLNNIIKKVKEDYVEEKTNSDLFKAAANGILTSLDPHSSYLSNEDFREMRVQTKGQFGGVGIEITVENSFIKVVSPIEGTPAYKAGIKSGDYISKIDGKSAIDIDIMEAVKKLRGKPKTKVNITILRKGEENPIEFYIKREIIKIKAVRSNIYEDVAYIKINTFSGQAFDETKKSLEKQIKKIGRKNINGIVLDLRNNPGGLLDQSVKISDLFLDKGQEIVSIKGRKSQNDKIFKDSENQKITKDIPVIVLINEGSASASEIVAGALQDNKRALVLGQKSFGKGSVQSVIPLDKDQGALRMTTALYYTPSGRSIQAKGVMPDVIVTEAKIQQAEDKSTIRSESTLNGHIKNGNIDAKDQGKLSLSDKNIELYNEDYQLARAIDLVRGISFYKKIK